MESDSQSMKSEATSPTGQGDSEELKFLRELARLWEENEIGVEGLSPWEVIDHVKSLVYKRIQEVEMRDWNI